MTVIPGTRAAFSALVAAAALTPVLFVAPASAAPVPVSLVSSGSCVTEPYSGGCLPSTTSTTTGVSVSVSVSVSVGLGSGGSPTLVGSYVDGRLTWYVTGLPVAAAGTTVQLYVGGQAQTGTGGTAVVDPDGSTPATTDPICLPAGTYALAGVDQSYPEAVGSLTVTAADACAQATANQSSSGTSGGGLAFTGLDALRLAVAALVVILVGFAAVRLSRVSRDRRGLRR
jgi:hypothetical protein